MTITLPNLDDRRWADLVDEGRALISLYAPQWNDHNYHDPGITFMELLAWIAEMDMYRLNRVTDERRKKFLLLTGIKPRPAAPATTPIGFSISHDQLKFVEIPAGFHVHGTSDAGDRVNFVTSESVFLSRIKIHSLARIENGMPVEIPLGLVSETRPVAPFTDEPQDESAAYLGFSHPLPMDHPTTIYLSVPEEERTVTWSKGEQVEDSDQHHTVRLIWEYFSTKDRWIPIEPIVDTTRSLTKTGRVEFQPTELGVEYALFSTGTRPGARAGYFYLRVRVASGNYDKPPLVSGIVLHGSQAIQVDPNPTDPSVLEEFTDLDEEVDVTGAVRIGQGQGEPNQQLKLPVSWIAEDELKIWTVVGPNHSPKGISWERKTDFLASSMADRHFVFDPSSLTVTFGDGNQGRVVEPGVKICATYRSTLGPGGNIPAGTLDSVSDFSQISNLTPKINLSYAVQSPAVLVEQPMRATGGSAPELLGDTIARAVREVEAPQRCITLDDMASLAKQTPDVFLARVHAVSNHYQPLTGIRAMGVSTLIILPFLPANKPMPTVELISRVSLHLAPQRLLGTRIEVVAPIYVKVAIRAIVRACERVDSERLQAAIENSINAFLHPLRGGSQGQGWEFGRHVYRSEILQVIDETPGSDHVIRLELLDSEGNPTCGNVCVPPTGLVEVLPHEIEVVKAK